MLGGHRDLLPRDAGFTPARRSLDLCVLVRLVHCRRGPVGEVKGVIAEEMTPPISDPIQEVSGSIPLSSIHKGRELRFASFVLCTAFSSIKKFPARLQSPHT
jgi:hypothetical protein